MITGKKNRMKEWKKNREAEKQKNSQTDMSQIFLIQIF